MTREEIEKEFWNEVRELRDTYYTEVKGGKIIVSAFPDEDGSCDIDLRELEIPSDVIFENEGEVMLSIEEIPENVEFANEGDVYLYHVENIHPSVKFNNEGDVYLYHVENIHPSVKFNNEGDVYLRSLTGNWFSKWGGNIEGIASKRLLNVMISKGVFER
jgi:hypothetical protein